MHCLQSGSIEDKTDYALALLRQFTSIKVWIMSAQNRAGHVSRWPYGDQHCPLSMGDVSEVKKLILFPVREPDGLLSRTTKLSLIWSKRSLPGFRMINRWRIMEAQSEKCDHGITVRPDKEWKFVIRNMLLICSVFARKCIYINWYVMQEMQKII